MSFWVILKFWSTENMWNNSIKWSIMFKFIIKSFDQLKKHDFDQLIFGQTTPCHRDKIKSNNWLITISEQLALK
jgi:hypothetical protein